MSVRRVLTHTLSQSHTIICHRQFTMIPLPVSGWVSQPARCKRSKNTAALLLKWFPKTLIVGASFRCCITRYNLVTVHIPSTPPSHIINAPVGFIPVLQVEFYLPQLCMIVGLGDFTRPPALVEFLLELCQSDLRLAHKIHWFLKSYCSGGGSVSSSKFVLF